MADDGSPGQLPIHIPPSEDQRSGLTRISQARYIQNAWVVALLRANWIDNSGRLRSQDITQFLPLNQQGTANLVAEGIPEGSMVNFSSFVQAVGEYTHGQWFIVDGGARRGVEFEQRGTAFKGWFEFRRLYEH